MEGDSPNPGAGQGPPFKGKREGALGGKRFTLPSGGSLGVKERRIPPRSQLMKVERGSRE